ncbi:hypothetical protein T492DRAFT_839651 [Pavlovales sp. CCMP2436]|nr:hypothetical protein T492DRAFT_839651 [Pavlovales sp. CCMP2436]
MSRSSLLCVVWSQVVGSVHGALEVVDLVGLCGGILQEGSACLKTTHIHTYRVGTLAAPLASEEEGLERRQDASVDLDVLGEVVAGEVNGRGGVHAGGERVEDLGGELELVEGGNALGEVGMEGGRHSGIERGATVGAYAMNVLREALHVLDELVPVSGDNAARCLEVEALHQNCRGNGRVEEELASRLILRPAALVVAVEHGVELRDRLQELLARLDASARTARASP